MHRGSSKDSDLALATKFASEAILVLGFSGERRLVWVGQGTDLTKWREDGPIASELRRILDQAYSTALALIEENLSKVEAIADALLERRVLDHQQIRAIMTGNRGMGQRPSIGYESDLDSLPAPIQNPRVPFPWPLPDPGRSHPDFLRQITDWRPAQPMQPLPEPTFGQSRDQDLQMRPRAQQPSPERTQPYGFAPYRPDSYGQSPQNQYWEQHSPYDDPGHEYEPDDIDDPGEPGLAGKARAVLRRIRFGRG